LKESIPENGSFFQRIVRICTGLVNYLHTRACGAYKGFVIACFAGYASKTGNNETYKAREVGLGQEKRIIHKPWRIVPREIVV
jgi:hypothetical protein